MEEVTTVGIDLAKSVFGVHGIDRTGRTVLRKTVRREKVMELIATKLVPTKLAPRVSSDTKAYEWRRHLVLRGVDRKRQEGFPITPNL